VGLILPLVRRALGRLVQLVWKPAVGLVVAGLLAARLWRAVLSSPDGRLHLDVFNLPDGPPLLLRSPAGRPGW
jgi:hypothetical protein